MYSFPLRVNLTVLEFAQSVSRRRQTTGEHMKSVRVFFLLARSGAYQRWPITLVTTDAGFSLRTYDGCTSTSPSFVPVLIAYPILQSA
jgi:hypothetical protein